MATEPMITIKDADGTMRQVPLSQLSATNPAATPTSEPLQESDSTEVAPSAPTPPAPEPAHDDIAELAARAAKQVAAESIPAEAERTEEAPMIDTTEDQPTTDARDEVLTIDSDTSDNNAIQQNDVDTTAEKIISTEEPTPAAEPAVTKEAALPPDDAPDDLLVIKEPGALTTTVPNTHMFESDEDWDDTDHASLLDESLTEADTNIPHSTNRPGMAAALRSNTTPAPAPVQIEKKEVVVPSLAGKKPDTAQFAAAFAAVGGGQGDIPYRPGIKKIPMQDISVSAPTPIAPQPMGPVGELGAMTLDDFRRLGGRGEVGIADLRAKFEVLLKESIVTYMQGVAAWHRSPLYRAYLDVITASVSQQTPIADILSGQETNPQAITAAEWQALAHLHTEIRL